MKKNIISSLPTHQIQLCTSLHNMRKEGKFCDVNLRCKEKTFLAHRNILASQSNYFKKMFECKAFDHGSSLLDVDLQVDANAMEVVLDFIYSGKAEFMQENTINIMKTAHILSLDTMYNCCKATLLETINYNNYYILWTLAESFADDSFRDSVVDYTAQNFNTICEETNFLSLSVFQMKQLLSHENMINVSCDKILNAVVIWVKHDKNERKKFLSTLLEYVEFERLSKCYLQVLVEEEPIVWESPELMRHVTKTVCSRYLNSADSLEAGAIDGSGGTSIATNEETEPAIAVFGENEEKRVILQYYSIEQDEWCPPEELPLAMSNMAVVEHNGLVYLIGGKHNGRYLNTVYVYNVIDSKLQETALMKEPRSHAGVTELFDNIFVVGGYNKTGFLQSVECYDPRKEAWKQMAPMSEARGGVAVASLNRKLYAVGGRAGNSMTPSTAVECLDVLTNQWTQVTPLLYGRSHCGISVLDHRLYITGGYTKDDDSSEGCIQSYNPINKMWQTLPAPSIDEWITATVAVNRCLYVMTDGGQIVRFKPDSNSWTDRSLYPTIPGYYIAAVLVQKPVWDA